MKNKDTNKEDHTIPSKEVIERIEQLLKSAESVKHRFSICAYRRTRDKTKPSTLC